MDYKARFYSSYLKRWGQPDSIVPDLYNPQALNRYSYVLNNPIRYNDPSGHKACDDVDSIGNCITAPGGGGSGFGGLGSGGTGGGNSEVDPTYDPSTNSSPVLPEVDPNDLISLDQGPGPACKGIPSGPSCNPEKLKCFQYKQAQLGSWQWMDIPCSTPHGMENYYTYEGSTIPIFGLIVDVGGMVVDGASILASFGFPVLGILLSAETEFIMSTVEFEWSGYLIATGQYEAVYDHSSNLLDSTAARYNDSQKPIPFVGFASSFRSAINNIQVISSGLVGHPAYYYSWDGSPPARP